MHSCSSDVVILIGHVIRPLGGILEDPGLQGYFSDTGMPKLFAQCPRELPYGVKRQVGQSPTYVGARHPERVGSF
jgi:hypothetical protein